MSSSTAKAGALDWVLGKIAAAKKPQQLTTSIPKPPKFEPAKPVSFSSLSDKDKQKKRQFEEQLWHKWNTNGRNAKDFETLLDHHSDIIHKKLNTFRGAEVSKAAQLGFAVEHYKNAIETWDPNHPSRASLSTHIHNHLRRLQRFIIKHQNTGRITEPVAQKIGTFQAAHAELTEQLGYEPTLQQLVDHSVKNKLGLGKKDVLQINRQLRKSYDISGGGEEVGDAGAVANDPYLVAARVVYPMLKPEEQKVHELLFPRDGSAPVVKNGEMAKKLGWHPTKVSKIRGIILERLQQFVGD